MPADDLYTLSAEDLIEGFRAKTFSPVEATESVLSRIDACNEAVNAFVLTDPDSARRDAKASEERWMGGKPAGPIDGVPSTVKDTMLAAGWPTLRGSATSDPAGPWEDDAPITARMRESGAVILGKTTTPEYGWKGVTDSPVSGVTRNPWNTGRTPGGSSGGAAAAAALGFGALHTSSDAGGSIRIPASFCGVFGHKPTYGRVPAWPPSGFGLLSHIGPTTRTVRDAALMLHVASGADARDPWGLPPTDNPMDSIEDGVAGLKIAFSPTLGYVDFVNPEIAELVAAAARAFADLGATVEEVDPGFENPGPTFRTFWFSGAAKLLADIPADKRELVDEGLRTVAEEGSSITGANVFTALLAQTSLAECMSTFHEKWDLLLTPGQPLEAFEADREYPGGLEFDRWSDWTPFTYPFNMTRQPAASVPCGFTSNGLPAALQIVGPLYEDARVLRAARTYETAHPFAMPEVPIPG